VYTGWNSPHSTPHAVVDWDPHQTQCSLGQYESSSQARPQSVQPFLWFTVNSSPSQHLPIANLSSALTRNLTLLQISRAAWIPCPLLTDVPVSLWILTICLLSPSQSTAIPFQMYRSSHTWVIYWERWICGSGQCRSGNIGTMCQGWTMREWTMQEWAIWTRTYVRNSLNNACEMCSSN